MDELGLVEVIITFLLHMLKTGWNVGKYFMLDCVKCILENIFFSNL